MTIHNNAAGKAAQAQHCLIDAQDRVEDLRCANRALRALTQLVASCNRSNCEALPVGPHDLAELMGVVDAEIARCTQALQASITTLRGKRPGGAA